MAEVSASQPREPSTPSCRVSSDSQPRFARFTSGHSSQPRSISLASVTFRASSVNLVVVDLNPHVFSPTPFVAAVRPDKFSRFQPSPMRTHTVPVHEASRRLRGCDINMHVLFHSPSFLPATAGCSNLASAVRAGMLDMKSGLSPS